MRAPVSVRPDGAPRLLCSTAPIGIPLAAGVCTGWCWPPDYTDRQQVSNIVGEAAARRAHAHRRPHFTPRLFLAASSRSVRTHSRASGGVPIRPTPVLTMVSVVTWICWALISYE